MPRKSVSDAVGTRAGRTGRGAAGVTDEWCYGNGLLRRVSAARVSRPLPATVTVPSRSATNPALDGTSGFSGSYPPIPPLEAGEAVRFHDPRGSIRFLWPTDEGTALPFVGVLAGTDGSRYPLYLDQESAATHCRAACSVVPADSVPIDPPPHALTASAATGER